jgi:hypothetical protein
MAAVFAPHHTARFGEYVADLYGNDPFVWVSPFLWSHCHARSRPTSFGTSTKGSTVCSKDAVFFVSTDPKTQSVVVDCVFVIDRVVWIGDAEKMFPDSHPVRHYHFDHERSPNHNKSKLTRIADPNFSFIPNPPMPLESWVEDHVEQRSMSVIEYFRLGKRKNVRVITKNADGIYERLLAWTKLPGHAALEFLPLQALGKVKPEYPAEGPIDWSID